MAIKPFVTQSLQHDGAWNFAWYYASLVVYAVLDFRGLELPRTRTRTCGSRSEEDKDKDKDLSLKDEDKDKDLKIGPRGSSRTRTFLEDNNTGTQYTLPTPTRLNSTVESSEVNDLMNNLSSCWLWQRWDTIAWGVYSGGGNRPKSRV